MMTAKVLRKQQALDADPKAIQHINFIENLGQAGKTTIFFSLLKIKKKAILDFLQGTVGVL